MAVKETHTPPRSVRVPDELWYEAQAKATDRGETVSEAINRFLRGYIRNDASVAARANSAIVCSSCGEIDHVDFADEEAAIQRHMAEAHGGRGEGQLAIG